MAIFNTIISSIWEDDKFRRLENPESKLLFIYAFSNHRCPISGIYKISIETIAFEVGLQPDRCRENLQNLIDAKLLAYDFNKNVIWVRGKIRHDKSWTTKQRTKSVERSVTEFSKCSFMQTFYEQYPFLIDIGIEAEQKLKELRGSREPEAESPLEPEGASATEKDGCAGCL